MNESPQTEVIPITESIRRYAWVMDSYALPEENRNLILSKNRFSELKESKRGVVNWDYSITFHGFRCYENHTGMSIEL